MTFKQQLKDMKACQEAVDWVGDRTLEAAWAECDRGDLMLWLAAKADIDRPTIVLAACDCAEQALKYLPTDEKRPEQAIKAARAWCEGRATLTDVRNAADAAYAAADAAAADYAAYAAAVAAAAAADAAGAAYAGADDYAAYAAAAAADSAANAVYNESLVVSADLVRTRIPVELIADAMGGE